MSHDRKNRGQIMEISLIVHDEHIPNVMQTHLWCLLVSFGFGGLCFQCTLLFMKLVVFSRVTGQQSTRREGKSIAIPQQNCPTRRDAASTAMWLPWRNSLSFLQS